MQNLGHVYIWGSPFVMSRTDAQNGVDIIFKSVNHYINFNLYADLPGYISPSVLTGDELRPDLLITLENKCIYILEP
jgi:hypothetical protein